MTSTPIGKSVKRREDPRLITGSATYTDDIQLPRMAYAAVLRSPWAHARVRSIDVAHARTSPGVVAVYTGRDLTERVNGAQLRPESAAASDARRGYGALRRRRGRARRRRVARGGARRARSHRGG